jgi:hypothetical protein
MGGFNVHDVVAESGEVYIFDFSQGNYSLAVKEIEANDPVTPGTNDTPASAANVAIDVNEFSGNQEFAFEVVESVDAKTYTEGTFALDIKELDGAALVTLYDAAGKIVKERVVIRNGNVTFDGLKAGEYKVEISAVGYPAEVSCKVDYAFTQKELAVTDDTWENAALFGYAEGATAGSTLNATDVIDWFELKDVAAGTHTLDFTANGDFSVIIYTQNAQGELEQFGAFWVDDKKANGVDYTRYLNNVAAGTDLFIRIEGYGKDVSYEMSVASYTGA